LRIKFFSRNFLEFLLNIYQKIPEVTKLGKILSNFRGFSAKLCPELEAAKIKGLENAYFEARLRNLNLGLICLLSTFKKF